MIYIGIDPGKKGAIAAIETDGDGDITFVDVLPYSEDGYREFLKERATFRRSGSFRCCLEKVGAHPGEGVKSSFSFGENYGFIRGLLAGFQIPYQTILPQRWKKEFGLGNDKADSIEVCRRLFPDVSLKPTDRCQKDNDGMAEALLMAEYARRKFSSAE